MRQKSLSVHGKAYTEITAICERFYLYKVVSESAKSILACTENSSIGLKRIRIIRQEYFAVHGEYADRYKIEKYDPKSHF